MTTTTRTQWVFRAACGCPFGVLEGDQAINEYQAWVEQYGHSSDIDKAIGSGVTVQHMPHWEYENEVLPLMRLDARCLHGGVA